jgi:hypothetical protein
MSKLPVREVNRQVLSPRVEATLALIQGLFAFEANLNFIGFKIIVGWNEWQNWDAKVFAVLKRLDMPIVWTERPVCTENLIHVDEVTESPKLVE